MRISDLQSKMGSRASWLSPAAMWRFLAAHLVRLLAGTSHCRVSLHRVRIIGARLRELPAPPVQTTPQPRPPTAFAKGALGALKANPKIKGVQESHE